MQLKSDPRNHPKKRSSVSISFGSKEGHDEIKMDAKLFLALASATYKIKQRSVTLSARICYRLVTFFGIISCDWRRKWGKAY